MAVGTTLEPGMGLQGRHDREVEVVRSEAGVALTHRMGEQRGVEKMGVGDGVTWGRKL